MNVICRHAMFTAGENLQLLRNLPGKFDLFHRFKMFTYRNLLGDPQRIPSAVIHFVAMIVKTVDSSLYFFVGLFTQNFHTLVKNLRLKTAYCKSSLQSMVTR